MEKVTNDIWQYQEFVREYTKEDFKYADKSLKKDKAFIFKLIQNDYEAFEYIDESLKKDKKFILELLKNDTNYTYSTKPFIFNNMSETLKTDNLFFEEILKLGMYYFVYNLKKSDKFLLFLIKKYGYGLEYATDEQQADRELVLQAVKLNVNALEYVSDELKEDNDFILSLIKQTGAGLEYATRKQKGNRELVLRAIKHNPHALGDAHVILRRKKEVVLEAIKRDPLTLRYAHKSLQKDKSFVKEVEQITQKDLLLVNSTLFSSKETTELFLADDKLDEVPSSIRGFKQLKRLNLSNNNNITTLPDWIGELDSLGVLILDGNPLVSLPESITKLKKLVKLSILENHIEESSENVNSFLDTLLEFRTSSKNKILELKQQKFLCEIAIEKMYKIRFKIARFINTKILNLTTDKRLGHVLVEYKNEIWIFEIQRDSIHELLKLECYEARKEAYLQVKTLLHKKNVKLPLQIDKQKKTNGYKDITLTLLDDSSVVCRYNSRFHYYESEKPKEKQKLLSALHQTIFKLYEVEDYWEERDKRVEEMENFLSQIDKEHIYLLLWLFELDDFEYTKEVDEEREIEDEILSMALKYINKLDKTGEILYSLANVSGKHQFEAINYLIDRGEMTYLKEMMPLIVSTKDEEVIWELVRFFVENGVYEVIDSIKEISKRMKDANNCRFIDMLLFRVELRDISVIEDLIFNQHNPCDYKYERIPIGIDELINYFGEKEVLKVLKENYQRDTIKEQYKELFQNSDNANIRYWALGKYCEEYRDFDFFMEILKDNNWYILDYIAKIFIEYKEDINQKLKEAILDNRYSNQSKYWIIYILMKREEDVSIFTKNIPKIKIELPSFIGQNLRETIIKHWYKEAQSDNNYMKSDIRWLIEGMELEKREYCYDYMAKIEKFKEIITENNFKIEKVEDYNENIDRHKAYYPSQNEVYVLWLKSKNQSNQGDLENGCGIIEYDLIYVSKVGNFACCIKGTESYYKGEHNETSWEMHIDQKLEQKYKKLIEEAGFIYLTHQQDEFRFPYLYRYCSENEKINSPRVHDLLFY